MPTEVRVLAIDTLVFLSSGHVQASTPWEIEPGKLIRVFSSLALSFHSTSGGMHIALAIKA
jgi:hypothetical protein